MKLDTKCLSSNFEWRHD